jgi:hypothetical protein
VVLQQSTTSLKYQRWSTQQQLPPEALALQQHELSSRHQNKAALQHCMRTSNRRDKTSPLIASLIGDNSNYTLNVIL